MLNINLISFKDLTEDEKNNVPNNGYGKEVASYIKVEREGKTVALISDAVEVEDKDFKREFGIFIPLLKKVYDYGLSDGKGDA